MRKRDVMISTCLFLALVMGTFNIVITHLTGSGLFERSRQSLALASAATACTGKPAPKRQPTADAQLAALPEYEQVCGSAVADSMMIFTQMPISEPNAVEMADAMAARLKEFSAQNITPVVIVEPETEWGLVDFHEYTTGMYDGWTTKYFNRLKNRGVSDRQMGLWIPFPEPEQPYWNNNGDPDDFAKNVNRYFRLERSVFPEVRTGVLLGTQAGTDQTPKLLAYTRLIDDSLVDFAGVQGFPWHPSDPADSRQAVISAGEFASASAAEQVAQSLGTRKVLLNVGSYRHKLTKNGGEIAVDARERQATLRSITDQVTALRGNGYDVLVNVFAENKTNRPEGIDWSYWAAGNPTESVYTSMFVQFAHELNEQGATLSLYDARNVPTPLPSTSKRTKSSGRRRQ
ncbi:hypothetical protein FHR83_008582 [Actinoplanes campanulatus]|uniref:Uncharacterized protein n=1 Tax=Actinoplanes campanulatus TaxID=113559 RepID=A0A7W5FJP3_9ACTN|nr:hypothetical protein [Actinoplanes campanulatus]MBB3100856.1 hypothetical protein [Actinoplanes campanulatus]GGN47039.1 hypothetical protein GCM10010109_82880 [Actinoplanes campanulatus]GID41412.1 hypothetical protein Aca09nite_79180 [Actinoplanes campanulatus]